MNRNSQLVRAMLREEPFDPDLLRRARPWRPGERTELFRSRPRPLLEVIPFVFWIAMAVLCIAALFCEDSNPWVEVPLLLFSLAVLNLMVWVLARQRIAGYCPRCGNCVVEAGLLSLARSRWCSNCDLLLSPGDFVTAEGEWCLDGATMLRETDPTVKCLSTWMLLCMCDEVDQLSFTVEQDNYHCRIQANGCEYDMDPYAAIFHRQMVALARTIWGCEPNGDSQATGKIVVRCAGHSATVDAEFTPESFGEQVVFRFSDHHLLN